MPATHTNRLMRIGVAVRKLPIGSSLGVINMAFTINK